MLILLIVNFHSSDLIGQLLATVPSSQVDQVLVVNNSPDDSGLDALQHQYPFITLIESGENLGFGRACNLGLNQIYRDCPTAKVWLLNPDTEIQSGAIDYLHHCFQHQPTASILGTRIQDQDGQIWFNRGGFNPWLGSLPHRVTPPDLRQPSPTAPVTLWPSRWVSGCSLVLNLAQFPTCPQFDPGFFLYYEDNDFCERAFQAGHSIWVTDGVLITHAISALTNRNLTWKWSHATYGKLRFLRRHGKGLALPINLIYGLLRAGLNWFRGNRQIALGQWQGLRRALRPDPPNP